jgi:hypothetical protein
MATLTQSTQSMIEAYKSVDGMGRYINTIEVMNDTSQGILDDWVWMEANSGTKHIRSIRTGLPSLAWGMLYKGIPQSKSSKQQVTDTTGFVEGLSTVDLRQLNLYAEKKAAIRQEEGNTFIESMAQELVTAMFYHDPDSNPQYPMGLGARYGQLGTSGAAAQVIDGGGSGSDNTSIWFVEHGYSGLSVIYPKGTPAGMQRENMGRQRVLDEDGNPYYVEEEMFSTHVGFSVGDWQRIVRIANIDVSDLQAGTVDLYGLMRKGYYKLKNRRVSKVMNQENPGRVSIYCNRDVLEALDALGTNAGNADNFIRLRPQEVEGREVMTYRSMPIRETDAILNTEAEVTT